MVRAAGPERRTMPIPPRPGGVEMATMVSSKLNPGSLTLDFSMLAGEKNIGGELWCFAGVFCKKVGCRTWCFDGADVVNCVANVVF